MNIRPYILDASVAVKWFFETEVLHDKALEVLNLITEETNQFVVHDFFFIEFSAVVLRKSLFDSKFTKDSFRALKALDIITIPIDNKIHNEGISIATKYQLQLYDALYLTVAKTVNGRWLTADKKATRNLVAKDFLLLEEI